MTNENAIMRLMLVRHRNDNTDMLNEALDMAIEALQRGLENVNADSCSEKPNRLEPKTAESGSVESEMPEIKSNRTTGGMIYRQDAINALIEWVTKLFDDRSVVDVINEVPSAQPEIIRCKDCKWWDKSEDSPFGYCMAMKHGYMSANWEIGIYRRYKGDFYCADAERRTDDKTNKGASC